ncbi:unnamed protein product [Orchesella dallaii]|uniref:BTB domain-containing protein n=1 Tax=Orchesella dallaii TaxID=48710 RepID=A0ABP1PQY9_9HEXA
MATTASDFSTCDLKTDEVNRGEQVKAAWCLKNISNQVNLEALISDSSCIVKLGNGKSTVRLSFYFQSEDVFYSTSYLYKTLSLYCAVLSGGEGQELKFIVKLDELQVNLQLNTTVMTEKMTIIKPQEDRQKIVVGKRILTYLNARISDDGRISKEAYVYEGKNELCFGITVTSVKSTGQGTPDRGGELAVISFPEVILAQDLKDMFHHSHEIFSDLKLETKDGVETSTHMFIVAARSPVLKEIIEKESAKESFNGTIKILDFNAKPIIAILHWMYSGRLSDQAGNVIEEVVVAAKKYQLTALMKQLDKEMITICNTGNMFQLFETARKNHLPIALLQISAFIKE